MAAIYKLAGINRTWMENLFHRLFASARLNITINDRFGIPCSRRNVSSCPYSSLTKPSGRIKDGTITNYLYDPKAPRLVKAVSTLRAKEEKEG